MVHQHVVETLNKLDAAGIDYCVLRNYGFVTGESIDGDVDVLVADSQRERLTRLLETEGFDPREGDTTRQTLFKKYVPEHGDSILLDIYWNEPTYNGLPLLDGEQTLAHRRRYPEDRSPEEQIYVPRAEEYFVELVFHGALNKNRYREFYHDELERLRTAVDRQTVLSHARRLFGETGRDAMRSALDGEFAHVVEQKWQLVVAGCRKRPSLIPRLVWNLLLLREVIRPLRSLRDRYAPGNPAPVIALYGPDGAGKTTVATKLQETLDTAGTECQVAELGVYNDETWVLRTLKTVNSTVRSLTGGSSDSPTETDEQTETIGPRRSPVHALFHTIDIGIRTLRARTGSDVVIADRYVHDIVLYDNPGIVRRLFSFFERPPFFAVVLSGPPEEIARRSEYDAESIARMYDRIEELPFDSVDATAPPEEVVEEILSLLAETETLDGY